MQQKVVKQEMNTAQLGGKVPTFGTLASFAQCQSRDFPLSYAVIPSFISCSTTFCCIDPYFIFKLTFFKNTILLCILSENNDSVAISAQFQLLRLYTQVES